MAKAALIPKHVNVNLNMAEAFDLIMSMRSLVREFDNLPESIGSLLETLESCYDGDLPSVSAEADGGEAAAV